MNALISATSKVALASPRLAASARARSIAVKLALLDQRGEFGLWFTEAPRRRDAHPEPGSLAAIGRVEFEVLRCCHGAPQVVVTESAQWDINSAEAVLVQR